MSNRQLVKDLFVWGFALWLIGYILGIVFFLFLPPSCIGWAVLPIGVMITCWVLLKQVQGNNFSHYLSVSAVWTMIAVVLDYLLIVQALKPADGYYKFDVYLYYTLTFALPLLLYWWKKSNGYL